MEKCTFCLFLVPQLPQNSLNLISGSDGTGAFFTTAEDGPLKEAERVMNDYISIQSSPQASWPTMAVNLSKDGPALTDAYNEVVNGRTSTDW